MTHNSPTAVAYAASLLELAGEQQQAESVAEELRDFRKIVDENPTFAAFLSNPSISESERAETLKKIFAGRISPLLMRFLGLVNQKDRLNIIRAIADAYDDLLDEQLGKVEVDVTVAQRLDAAQLELVRQKVSLALKKDAVVHQYVDESIIGGLIVRFGDQLIDASVKHQLEAMREQLLAAAPK